MHSQATRYSFWLASAPKSCLAWGFREYSIINVFFLFQCNNCKQLVIHPDQRFSFFSDYSQIVSCPHCGVQEAHFAKNLPSIFAFIPRRGVTRVNSAWKKSRRSKKKPPPRLDLFQNNEEEKKKKKNTKKFFRNKKKHCYSSSSYLCAFPKNQTKKTTQSQN